jgi:hypothetical protein
MRTTFKVGKSGRNKLISIDNLNSNMEMYLGNKFPNKNDEYKDKIINKYGDLQPINASPEK